MPGQLLQQIHSTKAGFPSLDQTEHKLKTEHVLLEECPPKNYIQIKERKK